MTIAILVVLVLILLQLWRIRQYLYSIGMNTKYAAESIIRQEREK